MDENWDTEIPDELFATIPDPTSSVPTEGQINSESDSENEPLASFVKTARSEANMSDASKKGNDTG